MPFQICPVKTHREFRNYGDGRTQISLSSPNTKDPLAKIQDRQGLY